jgi:hypothetical protein
MNIKIVITLLLVILLSSCSTAIQDYQTSNQSMKLEEYFKGYSTAWGTLQDYSGKVTRRFCVDIYSTWNNGIGTLDEKFYFDDGEQTTRIWTIENLGGGNYRGTASDVVGEATGKIAGFAFHWEYVLQVPVDGDIVELTMDDWMFQLDQNRLVNKTKMKKFGITVAEVTLFFNNALSREQCSKTSQFYSA